MTKKLREDFPALPEELFNRSIEKCKEAKLDQGQIKKVLKRVNEEYNNALISPGEAIGVIAAESFGEPGTQMCTSYNEKIIVKLDNKIKIIEIGKFVDGLIRLKGHLKFNDSEILPLNDLEIYTLSLNQEEKIEWKRVIECSRHRPNKRLMKIKTASGRKIMCTDAHSFVTRIDNKVVPIKGIDLKIGDRIPVLNNFFDSGYQKDIDVKEFFKRDYVYENEEGFLETKHNAKQIPRFINLNKYTGWFIGAYLAEGFANRRSMSISNIDNSYIENVKKFANNIYVNFIDRRDEGEYGPSRSLIINSSLLSEFIVNTCGQGSNFKHVPDFAYNASNEFVSGLLRGYFDGDGNFHVDRKMIRASSNSKELLDGIALLLSRFKIFSFKMKDRKGQYWLLIPYKYAPQFLQYIGSDIDYKRMDLEILADKAKKFWNEKSQDYTDMISGFGDLFYKVAKKLGYRTRYVNNFTKRQKIGRTALFRYMKLFENLAEKKNIDIENELNIMKRMFNSDIIWDEVGSIEYVDYDHEYVYDLSVPGLETFTTFDGIITHNTLNVFHFAGVAEVAVTLGLPRLIEIFDARKEPSTPKMEIYLKRGFSDISEIKKVAAQIKETRLEGITTGFFVDLAKLRIEVNVDRRVMKDLGITDNQLVSTLEKSLKVKVKVVKEGVIIELKGENVTLSDLYQLKEKCKDVHVKGIKGISQVVPIKRGNEFVILTAGSNIKDTVTIEGVDEKRIRSNNIFEIGEVLGIEAARQAIIDEASEVIKNQGLDIDMRHIMFLADMMTHTGVVKGITRSGITGEKESVLARASFETPIKHIVDASLIGEEDHLNSVIENVILNQPVPLGTGLPDLVAKMKDERTKGSNKK